MYNYNTDKEVWKDIEGYEGYYQVSNLGRIKRKSRHITDRNGVTRYWKGRILSQTKNPDGYFMVILSKEGKTEVFGVHRLVAESFIENPNNYPVTNHRDENKENNNVKNLEWCSIEYNNAYGTRTERMKDSVGFRNRHKRHRKPVLKISMEGEILERFESLKDAYESSTEYTKPGVAASCNKKLNTYKGYFWVYESDFTEKELQSRIEKANQTQSIKVKQFDLEGNFIKEYKSMGQAARANGINSGSIHQCCNGKKRSAGNYKWEYTDKATQ